MRILYLLPAEGFGGAERQGVLHIKHLPEHGVDVVGVVGPGRPIFDALERAGASGYRSFSHFPRVTHANLSPLENVAYFARWCRCHQRSVRAICALAAPLDVDLIVANRTFAWLVAAPVAARLGVPYVLRAGSRPASPFAPLLLRLLCERWGPPAALLANCEAVRRPIQRPLGCPSWVVPNAVDTLAFAPRGRPSGPRRVVGMAARPAPEKGFELLLRTVADVCKRRPDVVFEVAGEFGWRPHFEREAERAGLAGHLRFLGHVSDVASFYERCDVVVLTSRERSIEGSPNALLEAMAMQRPVVATAVGGIPEIVRHGLEGFVVPPDAGAFVASVVMLIDDAELRERMGRAGRSRVMRRHAIPQVMATLAGALHSAASRGRRARARDTRASARLSG